MACFLVPVGEAVLVTAAAYALKAKQKNELGGNTEETKSDKSAIPFFKKLFWLANLLWGGAFLLCFEHIWHGEVVPWFPFLTAAADPEEAVTMLSEMQSVGGAMALLITGVWILMLIAVSVTLKRKTTAAEESAA